MTPFQIQKIKVLQFAFLDSQSSAHYYDCKLYPINNDLAYLNKDLNFEAEAILTRDQKSDTLKKKFLFLDDYGEELPKEIRSKLFNDDLTVGVIDTETGVFYVGFYKENEEYLTLQRVGKLSKDNSGDTLPDDFQGKIDQKRPYNFELGWTTVQHFLSGDEGWDALRRALVAVVYVGGFRYVAEYELSSSSGHP